MASPRTKQNAPTPPVLLIIFVVLTAVLALVTGWVEKPWNWIASVLQIIVTVTMVTYLVRFVRKQREDYWRERGKDPKHPDQ